MLQCWSTTQTSEPQLGIGSTLDVLAPDLVSCALLGVLTCVVLLAMDSWCKLIASSACATCRSKHHAS